MPIRHTTLILILISISAFQIPFIGTLSLGGASINTIKDLALFSIVALLLFYTTQGRVIISGKIKRAALAFFAISLFFSLALSPDKISGTQYFLKIAFPIATYIYITNISISTLSAQRILKRTLILYLIFLMASVAGGILLGSPQDGLTERHFFKFNAVCLLFMSFCFILYRKMLVIAVASLAISLIALFFIMQRGAFICIFIGAIFALYTNNYLNFKRAIISLSVMLLALASLFSNKSFIEYSFYEGKGPEYIISEIKAGRLDTSVIRDRERGALIEAMVKDHKFTLLPNGLSTAKTRIAKASAFFQGKEPHNDILVLIIDTGYIGFLSFMVLIFSMTRPGIRHLALENKVTTEYAKLYYTIGIGLLIGMTIWMTFSNVIIYSTSSLLVPIALLAVSESLRKNAMRVGHSKLQLKHAELQTGIQNA